MTSELVVYRWPRRPLSPGRLRGSPHPTLEILAGVGPSSLAALALGGFYDRVAGRLLLLYRRGHDLCLRVEGKEGCDITLDGSVSSDWIDGGRAWFPLAWFGIGRRSTFRLSRDGAEVCTMRYVRANWDVACDLTPFREPSDDDFVLFVHALIQDPNRRSRVVEHLAPAV